MHRPFSLFFLVYHCRLPESPTGTIVMNTPETDLKPGSHSESLNVLCPGYNFFEQSFNLKTLKTENAALLGQWSYRNCFHASIYMYQTLLSYGLIGVMGVGISYSQA